MQKQKKIFQISILLKERLHGITQKRNKVMAITVIMCILYIFQYYLLPWMLSGYYMDNSRALWLYWILVFVATIIGVNISFNIFYWLPGNILVCLLPFIIRPGYYYGIHPVFYTWHLGALVFAGLDFVVTFGIQSGMIGILFLFHKIKIKTKIYF